MEREQDIVSLNRRIFVLEDQLDKAESSNKDLKKELQDSESVKTTKEGLERRVKLLEDELDAAERHVKDVTAKYINPTFDL